MIKEHERLNKMDKKKLLCYYWYRWLRQLSKLVGVEEVKGSTSALFANQSSYFNFIDL